MFRKRMEALNDATPSAREFREAGGLSVLISPEAISAMIAASISAGGRETGGILIGRYGADGWSSHILEATPKPRGSRAGWLWFRRASTGLEKLLANRWSQGLHYVGEWHLHPSGTPEPSGPDARAMEKIAADKAYECSEPILVVICGIPKLSWPMSVTVFGHGRGVRLVESFR